MTPSTLKRKPDKRTNKSYESIYFWTLRFNCLNEYYDLFYSGKDKDRKKVIARNLYDLLTPVGLAFWIMDDGGKSSNGQTILHTRSFSKQEVIFIQDVLSKNFSLVTRIEEKKLNQWVIYIPIRQKVKLIDIVEKHMHQSMLYKVN